MSGSQGRMRIGLIIPPADGMTPQECGTLYPEIDFSTVGLGVKEMSAAGFNDALGLIVERARQLADRGVAAISLMGTSLTFYRGRAFNDEISRVVANETGLPITSMSTSVVRALKANHVSKVALATAYTVDLNERLSSFLADHDIQTRGIVGLGLTEINSVRPTAPEAVRHAAESAFDLEPSANGILISCGGLPTLQLHALLEQQLGVPVVSSLPAALWDVVQLCGADPRVQGFGRMFEIGEPITAAEAPVTFSPNSNRG